MKVCILSVTEGSDKPLKYPLIFREAQVLLLNKIDLLPYTDFNMDAFRQDITNLNPDLTIFPVSARTGEGLRKWCAWLKQQVSFKKTSAVPAAASV
ncbi:MAG: hypothetical protein L5656_03080 [Thermanaeromonas sp.]|nr:GTP-binding protein [Thermanaeromonas sp.]MCG0277502.1 hypothetical protein [Thermanaeromonas sp.]